LSAPVLSWLFTAKGKVSRNSPFSLRLTQPCTSPLFSRNRPVAFAQLNLQEGDPLTQPSEPILFPKLRIYFADFPYLLYSIDQRLLTLETWCGYWYEQGCE